MTTPFSVGQRGHVALALGVLVVVLAYLTLTPANVFGGAGVVGVAVVCAVAAFFALYVAVVERGRQRFMSLVGLALALSPVALSVVYVTTSKG